MEAEDTLKPKLHDELIKDKLGRRIYDKREWYEIPSIDYVIRVVEKEINEIERTRYRDFLRYEENLGC